jgi:hypothetical protein
VTAVVLYLAMCWSGHDAGKHEIIVHHLMASPRECAVEIKLWRWPHHPQDDRPCACVPVQQVDVTPHE